MIERIVSGGQTGADRGGLEAALALGIAHGGWCPKGRRAEDGSVPERYQLRETSSAAYSERTRRNVADADGTVLFTRGTPTAGSKLTLDTARQLRRPVLHVDVRDITGDSRAAQRLLRDWLEENRIRVLNVAGSRESGCPGIEAAVAAFLVEALRAERAPQPYRADDHRPLSGEETALAAESGGGADAPVAQRKDSEPN
jgi:Circularly permutated YpsA SLOG family